MTAADRKAMPCGHPLTSACYSPSRGNHCVECHPTSGQMLNALALEAEASGATVDAEALRREGRALRDNDRNPAEPNGLVPPIKISGLGYVCDQLGPIADHPVPADHARRWADVVAMVNGTAALRAEVASEVAQVNRLGDQLAEEVARAERAEAEVAFYARNMTDTEVDLARRAERAEAERDAVTRRYDECATDNAQLMDERDALKAALAGLLDADDATFCQGEFYIAEDEQAECMACPWCRARVALGRPEANAVAVDTPHHDEVLRSLTAEGRAEQAPEPTWTAEEVTAVNEAGDRLAEVLLDEPASDVAYYYAAGMRCCDSTAPCSVHHNAFLAREQASSEGADHA